MSSAEKVSFTIRRPTPLSRAPSSGADSDGPSYKIPSLPRHLANPNDSTPGSPLARSTTSHEPDSSDEDEEIRDELVTGFDRFGVQRLSKDRPMKAAPLVIPALKNRDWRDLARKRRSAAQYVPPSAKAETGKDGSVGGLGTRDSINSGPVLSGLQVKERSLLVKEEDEQAIGILQEDTGAEHDGPIVHIIQTPISEADAYKQDVDELPDAATLDDYSRVPVSQFGAALLRGMGWKEGTAATRQPGKGLVQPYLPEARPALLGIGAKEREVLDDGSGKKGGAIKRPERRYVPLVKKERDDQPSSRSDSSDRRRERSRSPRPRNDASTTVSRRSSKSRERGGSSDDRRRDEDRRDRDYRRDDRDRDRDYRHDDRDRERPRGEIDRDRRRDRSRELGRRRRD
ncbi:DExH-box splicing factor binding site-domain-containing protein [Lyophyllum atratum]|nr:DExH-box splicing factor binding site-domain-containing protein [Lyophyllum atratum]